MKTLLALIALACCFGPCVQAAPQDNIVPGLPVDNCHYGIIGNTALSTDGIIADLNPQIRIGGASGEQPCTLAAISQISGPVALAAYDMTDLVSRAPESASVVARMAPWKTAWHMPAPDNPFTAPAHSRDVQRLAS